MYGLAAGARAPQFMSLLVKAMKADVSVKRVAAFAKRLLQVGTNNMFVTLFECCY
jgi:ribosome biogenesis protein MAK21